MSKSGVPAGASQVRPAAGNPADRTAAQPAQAVGAVARAQVFAAEWAPTAGRVLLGLVLAWFGYHELVQPQLWTGYVPVVSASSQLAVVLVLVHGWVLLVLAVAIVAGVTLRLAAAISALALLQIVVTLAITGGLTDLTMRDVGVLGLAICLTGRTRQRAVLVD